MISDENLKQLREMVRETMLALLEEYGFKKPAVLKASANAARQRRFRERKRNAESNKKVTRKGLKRNAASDVTVTLSGNAVAYIPVVGGEEFGVSQELVAELELAYPQVDVPQTLREVRVWCIANPTKQKTRTGIMRFVNHWLAKEQNKG